MRFLQCLPLLGVLLGLITTVYGSSAGPVEQLFSANGTAGDHTNNWAVLVCASRFWFNYRHMANTLGMYRTVKRLGIPDSHIILMLADDAACNPRNSYPAKVYANSGRQLDLYGESIEVDYRGYDVTVESFLRLLTGRTSSILPPSKRLLTDASSNVFVYLTGHGGNEFLKFQDNEEISAFDIADAIEQMWEKRRYNKLLFMIDTCEANTMYSKIYSPNVISTGSSMKDESSYAHHADPTIGVSVIDSFTHNILQYLERITKASRATLADFFATYDPVAMRSHPGIETSLSPTPPEEILITDFFGGVANVEVLPASAELDDRDLPLDTSAQPLGGSAVTSRLSADLRPTMKARREQWLDKGVAPSPSSQKTSTQDLAAWLLPLFLALLAAYWATKAKSDQLDAETQPAQWAYRSEGGAHSVYAFSGSNRRYIGKLLRVPKSDSHISTDDELAAIWRKDLLPTLIPRKFLPSSVPCELDSRWVADLEASAESTRPEHRKDADIETRLKSATEAKSRPALLMEDLVGTGGLRSGNRVLVAEIKPKWGFMPQAQHIVPLESVQIKTRHCRYCLHQHMRDRTAEAHRYCPLDLYSGDNTRVSRALRGLWESWQSTKGEGNNWRIFIDGHRLREDIMSPLESLIPNTATSSPAQLTESILLDPLINTDVFLVLKQVQRSLDPFDISKLAEDYRSAYPNTHLFDKSVLEEISSSELSTFVRSRYHSDPSTWTLRERLIAYTLSATFKDCSVFVRVELQPATGRPGYEPVLNGVSVKVIDLDVKSISKLAKWAELDEQIWRAWEASGNVGRDPCVL